MRVEVSPSHAVQVAGHETFEVTVVSQNLKEATYKLSPGYWRISEIHRIYDVRDYGNDTQPPANGWVLMISRVQ